MHAPRLKKYVSNAVGFTIAALMLISCGRPSMQMESVNMKKELDGADLSALGKKKIFFGHMSVGYNIMEGMKGILSENEDLGPIHLQELTDNTKIEGAGLYHMKNGPNGKGKEKCDNFRTTLEKDDLGKNLDVALVKFCYIDMLNNPDIKGLFEHYVETVDRVKELFPSLTIVHVTVPLTVHSYGIKSRLRNLIKGDRFNVQLNMFNKMMREKYQGIAPIYDLAAVESTRPDGTRESFSWKGETWYALYPPYTSDGGHLNQAGGRVAAVELLKTLSGVVENL